MNVALMNQVEEASGSKAKMALLRDADERTKHAIKFATDPFKTFGITVDGSTGLQIDEEVARGDELIFGTPRMAPKRVDEDKAAVWWFEGFSYMDRLAIRELTGTEAHRTVVQWLRNAPSIDHAKWAARVLNKDLRCGVSQETVVKLWPGLIEPFRVALAHPYDADKHDLGPGWLEPKLDGLRMVIIDGHAYTRNGNELHNVGHIVEAFSRLGLLKDWVWDGECLNPNVAFEETVGTLRRENADGSGLIFHPFDVIARDDWKNRDTPSCDNRKRDLQALARRYLRGRDVPIKPIIGNRIHNPNLDQMVRFRDQYLAAGLEGAMYKDAEQPYQFKRSDAILKFKRFETMDTKIVDVIEGNGKIAGMLGALVVEIDNVRFNVGSGYTEAERIELWGLRDALVGKTVEVKYQNKTAKGKGRFPTYVRMRPDKDTNNG